MSEVVFTNEMDEEMTLNMGPFPGAVGPRPHRLQE